MPFLSLTTWSLHRNLGPLQMTRWDEQSRQHILQEVPQPANIRLLDLPELAGSKGFRALEVCHFHFPDTDPFYLRSLRESFAAANVIFYTLLIDYGDISSADPVRRAADLRFIQKWIDIAALAGAERVRVIAGDASPDDQEALLRAEQGLKELAAYGKSKGVRVVTENFRKLTSSADNCLRLLQACQDEIGFTSDFGNFAAPGKYGALERVVPHAESVHAKAHYDANGEPDADEFRRCLDIVKQARYRGPFTLVYDGPGDQWDGIGRVRNLVEPYLAE